MQTGLILDAWSLERLCSRVSKVCSCPSGSPRAVFVSRSRPDGRWAPLAVRVSVATLPVPRVPVFFFTSRPNHQKLDCCHFSSHLEVARVDLMLR